MTRPLVVVGDALLDRDIDGRVHRLCPDAPAPVVDDPTITSRPGGAGLAAALAASETSGIVLVTALGDDEAGAEVVRLLEGIGVSVVNIGLDGRTPEKVRIRGDGHALARLDHGGRGDVRPPSAEVLAVIADAGSVLVSDYGRGVAAHDRVRAALADAVRAGRPVVWDPHPRGPDPVAGVRLATPNEAEAVDRTGAGTLTTESTGGRGLAEAAAAARLLRDRWQCRGVAVTLGARGALLVEGDGPAMAVAPPAVSSGDPCGAGDRFAATAALRLADGAFTADAVAAAVATASSFVAAGGAAALDFSGSPAPAHAAAGSAATPSHRDQALLLARQVRAAGGTVVAAGGCFDLLHTGHVSMLQAARRLGDCLIVCLNSDASVRALKGPDRPLVSERDRAEVLLALGCVDAVAVFDEPTPVAVLEQLRPHLFAKGGDYRGADLPEAAALAAWSGEVVVLPYLDGRSTTRLLQEVREHAR